MNWPSCERAATGARRQELRGEELRGEELRGARAPWTSTGNVGHRLRRRLADDEERAYLRPQHLGLHPRAPQARATALPLITPSSRKAPLGAAAAGSAASAAGGAAAAAADHRQQAPARGARCSAACRAAVAARAARRGVLLLQSRRCGCCGGVRACRSAARRGGNRATTLLAAATARLNSRCDRWPSPLVSYCAKSAEVGALEARQRVALASAGWSAEPTTLAPCGAEPHARRPLLPRRRASWLRRRGR